MSIGVSREAAALCADLQGADPRAYVKSLETLNRRPDIFEAAKPAIVEAMTAADDAQRFDLAFALASLGSRDRAVLGVLAETAAPLSGFDALEPFCEAPRIDRARLTANSGVTGELVLDASGTPFLTPIRDHRGGGLGAVRLLAWSHDASGHRRGAVVKITGYFKAGVGLLAEKAWSVGAQAT